MGGVFRVPRRRLAIAAGLLAAAAVTGSAAHAGRGSAAVVTAATYSTQGAYTWTVPPGVSRVVFTVYGAGGGGVTDNRNVLLASGGAGAETKAAFRTKPGTQFLISVGGRGADATPAMTVSVKGGWNGGGDGQIANTAAGILGIGGGGGASAVSLDSDGSTGCAVGFTCGFSGRIVVAGGGGGGVATSTGFSADGGNAGGIQGGDGALAGTGSLYVAEGAFPGAGGGSAQWSGEYGTASGYVRGRFGYGDVNGGGGGWFGGGGGNLYVPVAGQPPAQIASGAGGNGLIGPSALSGSFLAGTRYGDGEVIVQTG